MGKLSSKRDAKWQHLPLAVGGKKKRHSLGLQAKCGCLEQEQHDWQHTHGFILHPFALLGASAGCCLPGAAGCSACPAVAGGGWLLRGGGGRDDVPFAGRAAVMAVPSEAWSAGSASAFS